VVAHIEGETDALPLPAGTKVKPSRIEGSDVHFSVAGTAQGKVPVAQTNLVEQLMANPPPAPVTAPAPPVVAQKEPTPTPAVEPMPVKEPEVVTEPTKEPAPAPAPKPVASASLSAEEIVKLMQESIRSGQIKEFTFDQVIGWKAGEEEELEGEKFQTGLAAYKAETIFGVKNIQAKALIQGGKVMRWIWPTSGLEIQ
jgi:outer membrane biosynthesis protein TonB